MMKALSKTSRLCIGISRHIYLSIFYLCTFTSLLQSSTAISLSFGSVRAELFHRDHPFSRQRSANPLGNCESLQNDATRSTSLLNALANRRGLSSNLAPSNDSTTVHTTVTDTSPYEYLMSISLGTPAQNFVAVVDTGSDLTWLQCKPCQNCFNQPDRFFDPSLSSTYRNLSCASTGCLAFYVQNGYTGVPSCSAGGPSCGYFYWYADKSNTSGTFASETLNLNSTAGETLSLPEFWFGCSSNAFRPSGLLDDTDGLVGLGQGLISFPSQLGGVLEDKFSYCLVNRSVAAVLSSPLVFGSDATGEGLQLQYTPIIRNDIVPMFYYIGVEGITVNGVAVEYNQSALEIGSGGYGGTVIDSGTTYSALDSGAFDPLLAAVHASFPSKAQKITVPPDWAYFELCYNVSGAPNYVKELPQISFKLANVTSWDLDAEQSWRFGWDGDIICLSISRALGGFSILGNTQQQDFHVLYDRITQRIGFTKTDCGAESVP